MSLQTSYRNIKFPPHVHREYPKWVGSKLVNNEAEELTALEELTEAKGNDRKPSPPNRK